jgi:hypothetical protein
MVIATTRHLGAGGHGHISLLPGDEGLRRDDASFDWDYWLAHCEGYRVDADAGRIGFVDEVRLGSNHPSDTVLAVRTGRLGRRVLLVPAAAAASMVPRFERIWLRSPVTIAGTEPR